MSTGGQGTKRHRNIAKNFSHLSRVHERYRWQTDGRTMTFAKNQLAIGTGMPSPEWLSVSMSFESMTFKIQKVTYLTSNIWSYCDLDLWSFDLKVNHCLQLHLQCNLVNFHKQFVRYCVYKLLVHDCTGTNEWTNTHIGAYTCRDRPKNRMSSASNGGY